MKDASALTLHPLLRGFPGAVLELAPDGTVLDSNGVLERRLERGLAGRPLGDALDAVSRRKLEALLARRPLPDDGEAEQEPSPWELVLEGRDAPNPCDFHPVRDEGGERLWLVERPRDLRFDRLYEELAAVNSEQANTQRQLAKEKARLARALEEVEREFRENERLARALRTQNEEMEAQNEELLSMSEEMHAGQEQLLAANQQLERRTLELQVALSARNRFYASMSHELRTPVNAVMGYNDLLLAEVYGPLNEQQELAVERSQRAAEHLRRLVDDILDISRLETGRDGLEPRELRVDAVVEELMEELRPQAEAAGAELRLVRRGTIPAIRSDPERVRQILAGLLSNGIRFGEGSPVWVTLSRWRGAGIVAEVTDGGPGIAEEDRGRIFDEFVQLAREENLHGPTQGTGLGLSVARRMAALLGGTLEVTSTVGVGSTFRLTLPPTLPGG
jgi:signal transduction histidine kinase